MWLQIVNFFFNICGDNQLNRLVYNLIKR